MGGGYKLSYISSFYSSRIKFLKISPIDNNDPNDLPLDDSGNRFAPSLYIGIHH